VRRLAAAAAAVLQLLTGVTVLAMLAASSAPVKKSTAKKKTARKRPAKKKATTGPGRPPEARPRYLTPPPPRRPKRGPARSQGAYVCRWIEANCVHTNDRWVGVPFKLLPWQRAFIMRLFEVDPKTNRRIYRTALLGVAKKNGKTELAAALACYFAIGAGEPSALVVCAAASDDQADLVFAAAKTMCRMSPTLSQLTEPLEDRIVIPSSPGSMIRRYAVGGGRLDGPNIFVTIIDEFHEWVLPKHEQTHTVLTQGGATRREPLVLKITTAGSDVEGTMCGEEYSHGVRVAQGEVIDETLYFEWWQAAPDADWKDEATWAAAHPSLGVTVDLEYLREMARRRAENTFRRYFMNQWVDADERWIPSSDWFDCKVGPAAGLNPSSRTWVNIDVAKSKDSTAVAVAQPIIYRNQERIFVHVRVWANPYPRTHQLHSSWRLNIFEVENYLTELYEQFPVPTSGPDGELIAGPEFTYDPMYFGRSAELLAGQGLNMIEWPQTDERMIPVARDFLELIATKTLAHDGDSTLARHVGGVVEHIKPRGSRMSKPKNARRHIDGAIAAGTAAHRAWAIERDAEDDEFAIW
jgi:phage terminase large subunit-like protein